MKSTSTYIVLVLAVLLVLASFTSAQTNTFPSSGNAGIGTTSPTGKLDINAVGGTDTGIVFRDSGNSGYQTFGMKIGQFNGGTTIFQTANSTNFRIQAGASASAGFFMNTSGNVGIGTTNPQASFDIFNTNLIRLEPNNSGSGEMPSGSWIQSRGAGLSLIGDGTGTPGNKLVLPYYNGGSWLSGLELPNVASGFSNLLLMKSGGNVGIGTSTPNSKLQVNGSLWADGIITSNSEPAYGAGSQLRSWGINKDDSNMFIEWGSSAANTLYITDHWRYTSPIALMAGNVGVGTASPGYKLDVNGEINATGFRINGTPISSGGTSQWSNGSNSIYYNSGSVGVGTTSANARLQVLGGNGPADNTASAAPDALQVLGGTGGNGNWGGSAGGPGGAINLSGGIGGVPVAGSSSAFGGRGGSINLTGGTGGPNTFGVGGGSGGDVVLNGGPGTANTNGNVVLADLRGNVGVGTASPNQKLSVAGVVQSTSGGFMFPDGTTQVTAAAGSGSVAPANIPAGQFGQNTNGGTYAFPGNIGVGIPSPGYRLDVYGAGGNYPARVASPDGYLVFGPANAGWSHFTTDRARFYFNTGITVDSGNIGSYSQDLNLQTSGTTRVTVNNSTGKVGINNTSPQYQLDVTGTAHVTGNMTIDGNISAKYQDVAEWVPSSEQLSAGTVVVLDATKSNQVTSSSVGYDTRVAGVVSEQPGIALGEKSESKVLVATTGRVRVKVDATKAPIHVGDLLVTSDVPGVAMKSEPVNLGGVQLHRPGTLIGKALEPLEKGKGEILVLLSLQ